MHVTRLTLNHKCKQNYTKQIFKEFKFITYPNGGCSLRCRGPSRVHPR